MFLLFSCSPQNEKDKDGDFTSRVNNFHGSHRGNVFPGVAVPFGMVKLGPDMDGCKKTNGYCHKGNIIGFSHTHTSGTGGGPRYGNILVTPMVGDVDLDKRVALGRRAEYASPSHYYVELGRSQGDVACRLTSSEHVGFHNYRFFTWDDASFLQANVLVDISHTLTRGGPKDTRCTGAKIEVVNESAVKGYADFKGGWGEPNPYRIFFFIKFDKPFERFGTWKDKTLNKAAKESQGKQVGFFASYKFKQDEELNVRTGISYISTDKARNNLAEVAHLGFDDVRARSDSAWNDKLGRIQVKGGYPEQIRIFYSSLRNTFLMPTDVSGQVENYTGTHFWDHYCVWDVFRTVMPLHALIDPEHQVRVINNMLGIYKKEGWLLDSWVAGDYSDIQGGTNADCIIADAMVKGLDGFNKELAYEAVLKNATQPSDNPEIYGRYLQDYLDYGYVLSSTAAGSVSRTMEYAYNDYCLAQVAKEMGDEERYEKYLERSQNVLDLFYDSAGYFWAKDSTGEWFPGFSKHSKLKANWHDPYFYEGGSETYSAYVPHDMEGLIQKHGGPEAFMQYLDRIFESGNFKLANEPLFLLPYAYHYASRPDKTAVRVRGILKNQYNPSRNGLPGQDDSGAMSAWYAFSSMGLMPVTGQDVYLIGSPLFDHVKIKTGENHFFEIEVNNNNADNIFIQEAELNGKPYNLSWITHKKIVQGGKLSITMGPEPSDWGQQTPPPSITSYEN